jgi:hypothetical protein
MLSTGDPVALLEVLDDMGVTVTLDRPTGQLHARPRPLPALAVEIIRTNRPLVHAVLLGAHTGHVWTCCDECGAGLMRRKSAKPRRCVFTPQCDGRHRSGKAT